MENFSHPSPTKKCPCGLELDSSLNSCPICHYDFGCSPLGQSSIKPADTKPTNNQYKWRVRTVCLIQFIYIVFICSKIFNFSDFSFVEGMEPYSYLISIPPVMFFTSFYLLLPYLFKSFKSLLPEFESDGLILLQAIQYLFLIASGLILLPLLAGVLFSLVGELFH